MSPVAPAALSLLEEMEAEPLGWDSLDVDKLFDLWGFERFLDLEAKGGMTSFRYHPEHPEVRFALRPGRVVSCSTVRRAVGVIRELRRIAGV